MAELKRIALLLEREVAQYLSIRSQWLQEGIWLSPDPACRGRNSPVGFSVVGELQGVQCGYGFTEHHDWHRFDVGATTPNHRHYLFLIRSESSDSAISRDLINSKESAFSVVVDPSYHKDGRALVMFHEVDPSRIDEEGCRCQKARLYFGDGQLFTDEGDQLVTGEEPWWLPYLQDCRSIFSLGDLRLMTDFLRLAHQDPSQLTVQLVPEGYKGPQAINPA